MSRCGQVLVAVLVAWLSAQLAHADEVTPLRNDMFKVLEAADFTRNTGKFRADTSNEYPQWPTFLHKKGRFSLFYKHRAIPKDYLSLTIKYPAPQAENPNCGSAALGGRSAYIDNAGSTDPFRAEVGSAAKVDLKCWLPFSSTLGWQVAIECPDDPSPTLGDTRDMRKTCAPLIRDMQAIVNARLGAGGELPPEDEMPFDTEVLLAIAAALAGLGIGWPVVKFLMNQFLSLRETGGAALSDVTPEVPTEPYQGYQDDADYLRFRKKDLEKRKNDLKSYRRNFKPKDPGYDKDLIKQMQADIRLAEKDLKTGIKSMKEMGGRPPDLRDITYDSDVYADSGGAREGALEIDEVFNNRDRIRDFLHRNPEYSHLHDRILTPDGAIDQELLDKVKRMHVERMGNPLPDLGITEDANSPLALFAETYAGTMKDFGTSNGLAPTVGRCVLDGLTGGLSELVFTPAGEFFNAQDYFAKNHDLLGAGDDPGLSDQFNLWKHAIGNATQNVLLGEAVSRSAGGIVTAGQKAATRAGKWGVDTLGTAVDAQVARYSDDIARHMDTAVWARGQRGSPWSNSLSNTGTSSHGLTQETLGRIYDQAGQKANQVAAKASALQSQMDAVRDFGAFLNETVVHFDAGQITGAEDLFVGDRFNCFIDTDLPILKGLNGMKVLNGSFPTPNSVAGNLAGQHAGNLVNYIKNLWNG